jgi:hypothetical protein
LRKRGGKGREKGRDEKGRKGGTVTYFSTPKTTIPVNTRSYDIICYLSGDKDEIFIKKFDFH